MSLSKQMGPLLVPHNMITPPFPGKIKNLKVGSWVGTIAICRRLETKRCVQQFDS